MAVSDYVLGEVYPATEEGFRKLIEEANRGAAKGYGLVAVLPLSTRQIGAVWSRLRPVSADGGAQLFGEL